jgi:uncharacterized Zn finger protein
MCKHVAATLYGVGARLDADPELLFTLRDVDHLELINQAVDADNLGEALQGKGDNPLTGANLGEIFGIEIDGDSQASSSDPHPDQPRPRTKSKPMAPSGRKPSKAAKKRTASSRK